MAIAVAAVPVAIPMPPAAALDAVSAAARTTQAQTQAQPQTREPYDAQVMDLVNLQRKQNGCQPLRSDPEIAAAAYDHSRDMGTNGYFGHDTQAKVTPWTRMKDAGYNYPAAENIARGYATPKDVVAGWMNDPAHRANILDCSYKAAGVGYFSDAGTGTGTSAKTGSTGTGAKPGTPDLGPWWTQDFGYE